MHQKFYTRPRLWFDKETPIVRVYKDVNATHGKKWIMEELTGKYRKFGTPQRKHLFSGRSGWKSISKIYLLFHKPHLYNFYYGH
jgi:hypothetical protein